MKFVLYQTILNGIKLKRGKEIKLECSQIDSEDDCEVIGNVFENSELLK